MIEFWYNSSTALQYLLFIILESTIGLFSLDLHNFKMKFNIMFTWSLALIEFSEFFNFGNSVMFIARDRGFVVKLNQIFQTEAYVKGFSGHSRKCSFDIYLYVYLSWITRLFHFVSLDDAFSPERCFHNSSQSRW